MSTRAGTVLIIVAAFATTYATVSFVAGWWSDFTVSAITGVLALGGVFFVDELQRAALRRDLLNHSSAAAEGSAPVLPRPARTSNHR